ncbi:multicopper oxidase type 3 [Nitrosococcus halophilus Nc 4]|uniref:Multicopper oxidase type 3 n=1 Tax=Nitrosococcus halophilus (strain Nc4) TaxID=472759 RepID=D5BZ37_NITHN|nr:multicopper oxidase domain-containing protein [Nitrosococcus halophilus]ADE14250.1 multicopper oxidase type 3 [Nitrosococcus halophilus Nc 4]
MKFFNTWQSNTPQPKYRFLAWFALFFLGVLLSPQQILAKDWEFDFPIGEMGTFSSEEQIQGPLIHVDEGDDLVVHVKNNTPFKHTIRWHGVYQMDSWHNDGMSEMKKRLLSIQKAVEAGESFTYRWKAEKTGTFWYHYHINVNEHDGVQGVAVGSKGAMEHESPMAQEGA